MWRQFLSWYLKEILSPFRPTNIKNRLSSNYTGRVKLTSPTLMSNSWQNSYASNFLKNLFLQKRLPDLFELLTWCQKMMLWHPFSYIFIRSPAAAPPYRTLPFHLVLLLLQTTQGRRSPGGGPQSSAAPARNQFLVSGCIEHSGWWVLSRAWTLPPSK